MPKFTMPDNRLQYTKVEDNRYIVKTFSGIFEAATDFIGHGVSKVAYVCPESEQTNNVNGMYPRMMAFAQDPNNRYCARVILCVNEEQIYQMQKQFEAEFACST